ncbi:MAG: fumarylacetoacetate hydrolase family protein [Caulobacteraceae bacterium]|nr:fumarylacetoacetate hydrolase family protein [Caulobacter sp.]
MALTIYGVALNDRRERERLADAFRQPPYRAPPEAPVLYLKPAGCRAASGAAVELPPDPGVAHASPTLAVLFPGPPGEVGGLALALDVSLPLADVHRPAVMRQGRDGFLPLGPFQPWREGAALPAVSATRNGAAADGWSPGRMVRDLPGLCADIGAFMSLADGDILLLGAQLEPVEVAPGDRVRLEAPGHPPLEARFVAEAAA